MRISTRRIIGLAALCAFLTLPALAQTGIGTAAPNPKAALDITAADKGLLIPRMDSAARAAIAAPLPDGLMVFQTDGRQGFWYAVGGTWRYLPDKTTSGDNLGNHAATQALNLGAHPLVGNGGTSGLTVSNTGRVGIGVAATQALDVSGGLLVRANNAISTQGAYLHWNRSGSDGETWLLNQRGLGGANAGIRFGSVTTANVTTEWARFLNNGYLGIGISAPYSRLANTDTNIGGSDGQGGNGGSLTWAASQSGYVGMFYNADLGAATAGNGLLVKTTGANPNSTVLDVSTGASQTVPGTARLTVKGDGRVGIGTNNPTATLDVSGVGSTVKLGGLAGTGTRLVTVDATGNLVAAAALPVGTTGDNLGDHTATTNLNLGTHEIRGNGGTTGIGVAANGGLIIGQGAGNNVLVGQHTGLNLTAGVGQANTFVGHQAGFTTTTSLVGTYVGYQAGALNTTGQRNTFVGGNAGRFNSTGDFNTFVGTGAGSANTTGSNNTLIGLQAGTNNINGGGHTMLGLNAGVNTTSGDGHTLLGTGAGQTNTTGTGLTMVGYLADVTVNNLTNATAIGYGAQVSQSNSLVLGGTGAQTVTVGIGTTAPGSRLDVVQTARTGTHASGRALYVTGDFGEASNGAEFRHTNGTQGVGIGYNSIYATGSNADQHLNLMPRGTGKVGIGLTNPLYALDVLAPASLAGRLSSTQAGGTWWSLANSSAGAGGFHFIATGSGNGEGANKLLLTRGPAGTNTGYLITMDGNTLNVGIGTPSPTQALDVSGGLLVRANNAISTQGAYLHWNRSGSEGETWLLNQQGGGGANAGIRFGSVTTANVTTEWGRFLNNGNFGIGTAAPTSTLAVNGSVSVAYTTASANLTLTSAHYTVRRFGGCNTITLPQAGTCPGRLYVLINSNGTGSNVALTVTGGGIVYDDVTNTNFTTLVPSTRVTVQSDGGNWIVIGR